MATYSNLSGRSGLDTLLYHRIDETQVLFAEADEMTWHKWSWVQEFMPDTGFELWQLLALHNNLDPDTMSRHDADIEIVLDCFDGTGADKLVNLACFGHIPLRQYIANLNWAVRDIGDGSLKILKEGQPDNRFAFVRLFDFYAWAHSNYLPVLSGWNKRGQCQQETSTEAAHHRWPWGSHETELLRAMASVGELWRRKSDGGPFDPNDNATAPTHEVIFEELSKLGVNAEDTKKIIARIFRPRSIPNGPRTRNK